MNSFFKKMIPEFILLTRQRILGIIPDTEFESLESKEIFESIYKDKIWGQSADIDDDFCSGEGSHNQFVSTTYVSSVSEFLKSFQTKLDVVDLGCGDFSIGSSLRKFCNGYVACDIVKPLIERNMKKYENLHVDFRILDLAVDNLPTGDVLFVRQVLQHLSNSQIRSFIHNIKGKYRFLILTEHLPLSKRFTPNIDKPTGPNIRLHLGKEGSGIILTATPFNLKVKNNQILCEVESEGGLVRTNLYTF